MRRTDRIRRLLRWPRGRRSVGTESNLVRTDRSGGADPIYGPALRVAQRWRP